MQRNVNKNDNKKKTLIGILYFVLSTHPLGILKSLVATAAFFIGVSFTQSLASLCFHLPLKQATSARPSSPFAFLFSCFL